MWYLIYNFLLGIFCIPIGIFIILRNFRRTIREFPDLVKKISGKISPGEKVKKRLLLWCASVGEVRAIVALVDYLKNYEVLVSVGTVTGYQQARKLFSEYNYVSVVRSPWDFPFSVSKFLREIQPDIIGIVETEIWPNLIWTARRKNIVLVLLNGRFSRKSRRLFLLFRPVLKELLNSFSAILLRSEVDRSNLSGIDLKVPVEVTGNMKYDLTRKIDKNQAINTRKKLFPAEELIIVAGSIRPGEEKIIINAYRQVKLQISLPLRLLIAPRHPEMISAIEKCLKENNLSFVYWSKISRIEPVTSECVVVDTIGELFNLYGLADVAIVGGSFLDYGGQNPLEPAAWGCPVIFGKYTGNFSEEAEYLLSGGGGFGVEVFSQLVDNLVLILTDREKRITAGENARQIQQKYSGASKRNFDWIQKFLQ